MQLITWSIGVFSSSQELASSPGSLPVRGRGSLVPSLSAPVFTSLAVRKTGAEQATGAERLGTRLRISMDNIVHVGIIHGISPLTSLMIDQRAKYTPRGLQAGFVGKAQTDPTAMLRINC